MVARQNASPTVAITNAVDSTLAAIRRNHPELPPVVLVVGAKGTTKRGQVHGHFHADQWTGEDAPHEIMLSGESLARGPEATLGTILHEVAHAIAHARGVQDTSNNGRYHNKRFKAIAEEVGITVQSKPTLGWSATTVPQETLDRYAKHVAMLKESLVTYKKPATVLGKPKAPRNPTKFKIDCGCENPVTVSKLWFAAHEQGLVCNTCQMTFVEIEEDN